MIASPYGGVNIEEIAKTNPSAILKEPVDITEGTHIHIHVHVTCTNTCTVNHNLHVHV